MLVKYSFFYSLIYLYNVFIYSLLLNVFVMQMTFYYRYFFYCISNRY